MNNTITASATIETFSRRSDGSAKIVIGTQELQPADWALLGMVTGTYGSFAYAPVGTMLPDSLPDPVKLYDKGKTPSQRLRNIQYIVWEARGGHGDFEEFRAREVEKFIDTYKQELDRSE